MLPPGFGASIEFLPLPITREVAERAAVNRGQKKIKLPDVIILATAEVATRQLVIRNVKDFPAGMPGLGFRTRFELAPIPVFRPFARCLMPLV